MNLLIAVLGVLAVVVSIGVKLALALRARTLSVAPADDADDLAWLRAGPSSDMLSRARRAPGAPRHVPARRPRPTAPGCAAPTQAARARMPAADGDTPAV